ncbi:MAG TPA: zf-HC2 domain-containing protein [Terriglobales bacterium]|nr:zf-HC2 domain-containing protein [Terriglobales bacterium]
MQTECETWQSKIDPYIDAELSEKEEAALSEHLKSCPACSGEALGRMRLKQANQIVGRRYRPEPDLRARIQREVLGTKKRPLLARLLPAFAAAAAFLVIAYLGTVFSLRRIERQQVLAQVADIHVTDLASASPVDVVSSDRHTVKPWFQGRLPFTFDLPELGGSEFTLVGGRVAYLGGEPGAELLYKIRSHYLTVLILRDSPSVRLEGEREASQSNFHVRSWEQNGLRYFLITDAASGDGAKLSEMFKSAERG